MVAILGAAGVLLAFLGAFLPPLQALLPRLWPFTYSRQRAVRRVLGVAGAFLAALSLALAPTGGTWAVAAVASLLLLASEILLVPRLLIPPLDDPPALQSTDAETMIMGVVVDGHAHAYPLHIMIPHHIVNERVGGRAVAATYCPACRSGAVFDPVVRGRRLTFEPVSVRRRNMVMRDRETGTIWQQETGQALLGQLAGETLELLGGEICTWGAWKAEHGGSTVCARPPGYRHPHPLGTVLARLLEKGPEHLVGPGLHRRDSRLDAHAFVAGVVVNGVAKAYPLEVLKKLGTVTDRVGGVEIGVRYDPDADCIRAHADGRDLRVSREWWLAWSEYHPWSLIFSPVAD
jgi:hypothetical protein